MEGRAGAIPEGLESLSFLLGTWRGGGQGRFPTMEAFTFEEEIRFWHVGAPILLYVQWAWTPEDGEPLHMEAGIWRPVGEGRLAVSVALSRVAEISEGTVDGTTIRLESTSMGRAQGGAPLTRAHRSYHFVDNRLVYDVSMATEEVELTHHIQASLQRVGDPPA